MNTFKCKRLGVILRVHRREQYLEEIFKQIRYLSRGREAVVVVCADRPHQAVVSVLDRVAARLPSRIRLILTESPVKVLSEAGQKWVEGINHCVQLLHTNKADVGMLWDDDLLYSDAALRELRGHLLFFEQDRYEALWLHMWDKPDTYNNTFPPHWAAAAFRLSPGQFWDPECQAHCTKECAWSRRVTYLDGHAYHYGYFSQEDRELSWNAYKIAGKFCAHSLALKKEPQLHALESLKPC